VSRSKVDVVILTRNDGELLGVAVDSALASDDVDVEVFVVDNGSDPAATVPNDPRVHLIRNDINNGVAKARNQGIRAGTAANVLLLDSDAALEPTTLIRLLAPFDDDNVALSAPVFLGQRPADSAGAAPTLRVKLERAFNVRSSYDSEPSADAAFWDVDFAIGACQLFRRAAWERVGGIDEDYFYGPEDVDFCLRLRNGGGRVVQVGAAQCHHPPRRRHKNLFTRQGLRHGWAVARHLWRHRHFSRLHAA
jgi:GT2 family glycosyltransferase